MPRKSVNGGLDWDDVKSVGKKAFGYAKEYGPQIAPLIPVALGLAQNLTGKGQTGGKRLVRKDAPKKTPTQLKPWMRVVETVRADPKYAHLPYSQQLQVSKKLYRAMKP